MTLSEGRGRGRRGNGGGAVEQSWVGDGNGDAGGANEVVLPADGYLNVVSAGLAVIWPGKFENVTASHEVENVSEGGGDVWGGCVESDASRKLAKLLEWVFHLEVRLILLCEQRWRRESEEGDAVGRGILTELVPFHLAGAVLSGGDGQDDAASGF